MKSRDNTIDSVAGVMIVYMVFTHVCQHFGLAQSTLYLSLERVLYFFMPWFFFKAGMFFSLKDDKEVVRASASRLLKPFIIYSLLGHVVYVIVCAIKGNLALSVLFPIKQLVLNGSITGNLPLWFLLTLFVCRILLNLIGKTKGRVLALCLLSLVAAFLMRITNFNHPYYLANTMTGLTFMCLGYIIKKNYPPPVVFVSIAIYAVSFLYPSFVGMRSNTLYYGYYLAWILGSMAGIIVINRVASTGVFEKMGLHFVGRHSMQIYCLHWIPLLLI